MDAQTFLDSFGVIADAPNGIDRLRELILDLAARGRLVPQDPVDDPAIELLKQIDAVRKKLIRAGEVPKPRPTSNDDAGSGKTSLEALFEIPSAWTWTSLDDVSVYIQRGRGPTYVESSQVPVVSQKCIQSSGFDLTKARFVDEATISSYGSERFLRKGDLLWNSTGTGTVGRVNVFPGTDEYDRVVADSHVTVVRTAICLPEYLHCWLSGPVVQSTIEDRTTGTTNQQEFNTSVVRLQPVPLPPLREQQRIVAKVDELMQLCDELDARQQARQQVTARLRASSLDALTKAETADEIQTAWSRIKANWGVLTDHPDCIEVLGQAILDLAIRGLLTDQRDGDGTGAHTLETVSRAKDRLFEEGAIRRNERSLPVLNDQEPFPVPPNWRWCRFDELCSEITVGHVGPMASRYANDGVPFLRSQNVGTFRFMPEGLKFIDQYFHAELSKSALTGGEVLAVRSGSVGRSCVFPSGIGEANCADLVVMRPLPGVDPHYLAIVMNSPYGAAHVLDQRVGIAQGHFNVKSARKMPTPLPPTAEQQRISDCVRALRELCGDLETRLLSRSARASAYGKAVASRGVT